MGAFIPERTAEFSSERITRDIIFRLSFHRRPIYSQMILYKSEVVSEKTFNGAPYKRLHYLPFAGRKATGDIHPPKEFLRNRWDAVLQMTISETQLLLNL